MWCDISQAGSALNLSVTVLLLMFVRYGITAQSVHTSLQDWVMMMMKLKIMMMMNLSLSVDCQKPRCSYVLECPTRGLESLDRRADTGTSLVSRACGSGYCVGSVGGDAAAGVRALRNPCSQQQNIAVPVCTSQLCSLVQLPCITFGPSPGYPSIRDVLHARFF